MARNPGHTAEFVGLGEAEAARRLADAGPNVLPGERAATGMRILARTLREPMLLLLVLAAFAYAALGDPLEAGAMGLSVAAMVALAFYQERRAVRALESLRELSAPSAVVIRSGTRRRVAAREVVEGDVLALDEGDSVPADARIVDGVLRLDEAVLTGESVPVPRAAGEAVYAATLVVGGHALALVQATGARTELAAIAGSVARVAAVDSPLQRQANRIVRLFGLLALGAALGLGVLAGVLEGRSWPEAVLLGLVLALALLPEEIPMVLTVGLAWGAWRLARQDVLVRRLAAVEAVGGLTVLAVDKTGTLTCNTMRVAALRTGESAWAGAGGGGVPEAFQPLLRTAALACPPGSRDPMDAAIREAWGAKPLSDGGPEHEYPLSPGLLAITCVHRTAEPGCYSVASKGAPEAIADLCRLSAAARDRMRQDVERLAAEGLRVLAVAHAHWRPAGTARPEDPHAFHLHYAGLVALHDPARPEAAGAVAACEAAGIRVVMITGDHPSTAAAIARAIGLPGGGVLTGAEIESLDDDALRQRATTLRICARMRPGQKLRVVHALQAAGEHVGMTGDGVNDAPALAGAEVGIAMGRHGTEVARQAAGLVLLRDSLATIVEAVAGGRRIRDSLRAAMRFVTAVHVPVLALAAAPILLGWPVVLLPLHVVLLQLLVDPACSLLFQGRPAPPDLMRRPPPDARRSPFAAPNIAVGLATGAGWMVLLLAGCAWMVSAGWPPGALRGGVLVALVAGIGLLAVLDSGGLAGKGRVNGWVAWPIGVLAAFLLAVALSDRARAMFGMDGFGMAAAAGSLVLLALEGLWIGGVRLALARTRLGWRNSP